MFAYGLLSFYVQKNKKGKKKQFKRVRDCVICFQAAGTV